MINGESIWCQDISANDNMGIFAWEGGSHDAWELLIPVSPKH